MTEHYIVIKATFDGNLPKVSIDHSFLLQTVGGVAHDGSRWLSPAQMDDRQLDNDSRLVQIASKLLLDNNLIDYGIQ